MAHYIKFATALGFSIAGLTFYLMWSNWMGFMGFIMLFVTGSMISNRLFNRFATLDQVKEDIEAGIHID